MKCAQFIAIHINIKTMILIMYDYDKFGNCVYVNVSTQLCLSSLRVTHIHSGPEKKQISHQEPKKYPFK